MVTILQRLNELRDDKRMSARSFALAINMLPQTIDNQLKGKRSLSLETIVATLTAFGNVSTEWLIKGNGSMYVSEHPSISVTQTKVGNGSAMSIGAGASAVVQDCHEVEALRAEVDRLKKDNARLQELNYCLTTKLLDQI